MTTNPYIHPVPVGATIPAGTGYAAIMDGRSYDLTQAGTDIPRWTAVPIPEPAPPTEPWHWIWTGGGARCPLVSKRHEPGSSEYTLADWAGIAGDLRFADEADQS